VYDSQPYWRGDRVYWLRAPDASPGGHFEVLSMAAGDSGPRLELSRNLRSGGLFEMAGDRILWTEWNPKGSSWSIMTKLLTEERVQRIATLDADVDIAVNVCLTKKMIVWNEEGSSFLHVMRLDASGALGTPYRVGAGGANYSFTGLAAAGDRAVWGTRDSSIHTWRLGDQRQQTVYSPREEDHTHWGFLAVAMSEDLIAWAIETKEHTRIMCRTTQGGHALTLAAYENHLNPNVSVPSVDRGRVAWAVSWYPNSDERPQPGLLATWDVSTRHVQSAFTTGTWVLASSDTGVVVGNDSIAFAVPTADYADSALWVSSLKSRAVPKRAVNATKGVLRPHGMIAPPAAPGTQLAGSPAQGVTPAPSAEAPLPFKGLIVGLMLIAGTLALLVAAVAIRRRRAG
jgi:hypothetical protein